jgi:Flp pilus assembly protein protease CpaA
MIALGVLANALPKGWGVAAGDWRVGVYGLLVGFGILWLPFWLNHIKAGDVKYLAGVGALGGPWVVLFTFLYGSLVHGVFCLAILGRRGEVRAAFSNIGHFFGNSVLAMRPVDFAAQSQGHVPYALSLAVGLTACVVLARTTGNVFPGWT